MGIAQKHAYRFGFLKSEEWSNVRIEQLAKRDAVCIKCGHRNLSNDIHHISYPKSFREPKKCNMVILCRSCHEWLHKNMSPKAGPREQAELLQLAGPNKIYKDKKGRKSASAKIIRIGPKAQKEYKIQDPDSRIELGKIFSELRKQGMVGIVVDIHPI